MKQSPIEIHASIPVKAKQPDCGSPSRDIAVAGLSVFGFAILAAGQASSRLQPRPRF
jgi:hypothetical protein